MSDDAYDTPKPEIRFLDEIDYYDSTDFAQLTGEVVNDGWIGVGDAMASLVILRSDGTVDQLSLPVQVDNGPVTRGAKVNLAIENVSRLVHGDVQIDLTELSGADASGASSWSVFYGPIRNPFE
jgi:hypothetical protein